ncbi:hypothetical protein [Ruthenibacterium lactatiformans]|uniref:hypothetical protein n=1 Tax=Ruthenibacterium lactatiformans TaxID=1550024 RepID=UPI000240E23D|nr:hypothetical protein [Ruthenibacterium lactatiformans]EHL71945.1 hypothetical protein HMPREF1032_03182 [Subdoligranulum sp. 4_3_54A2FAA]
MNKVRRTQIQRVSDSISNIIAEIETIRDEEDEARESMPENLVGSERYETSEVASDTLQDTIDLLEESVERLSEIS